MKYIKTTRNARTKICNCHYELASQYRWQLGSHGYVMREQHLGMKNGKKIRKTVLLHRLIAKTPASMDTDHINGDKLDNRCTNLRVCTTAQNMANRQTPKGYKGVTHRPNGKYQAYIANSPRITIGTFSTLKEALVAYNKKATELYGEFAQLNKIARKI